LALAAEGADAGGGAGIDGGIVPIAFDAEHKRARLEIGAERAADHTAIIATRAGCAGETADSIRCEFGIAPAPAAVDADIDAGPVIDRQYRGNVDSWCARRRRWWQIGA
jgi:hypothetical protein